MAFISPVPSSFGEAIEHLEAIVGRLEGEDTLPLEEALSLYERGVVLAADCRQRLADAQLKLTQLAVTEREEPEAE